MTSVRLDIYERTMDGARAGQDSGVEFFIWRFMGDVIWIDTDVHASVVHSELRGQIGFL